MCQKKSQDGCEKFILRKLTAATNKKKQTRNKTTTNKTSKSTKISKTN